MIRSSRAIPFLLLRGPTKPCTAALGVPASSNSKTAFCLRFKDARPPRSRRLG